MFPLIDPIEVFEAAAQVIFPSIPSVPEYQPNPKDPVDRVLDVVDQISDTAPYVMGALLGAPAVALMGSQMLAQVVSKINTPPTTIKVCRTIPDLLIDSDLDPTGILRGGLNIYLGTLLPFSGPPVLCREIPVQEVVDRVKEIFENFLPLLGVASALKPLAKQLGLVHEVILRETDVKLDLKGLQKKIQDQHPSTKTH